MTILHVQFSPTGILWTDSAFADRFTTFADVHDSFPTTFAPHLPPAPDTPAHPQHRYTGRSFLLAFGERHQFGRWWTGIHHRTRATPGSAVTTAVGDY